jgi:hypothetical protein
MSGLDAGGVLAWRQPKAADMWPYGYQPRLALTRDKTSCELTAQKQTSDERTQISPGANPFT